MVSRVIGFGDSHRREVDDARAYSAAFVEANMVKRLAAKSSWAVANACLQTFGGFGFAAE